MKKLPLSKQLTGGAIFAGVSFVVSLLLTLITAGVPAAERTTSPWLIGMTFGMVAGLVYLLLANNRNVPLAGDTARTSALAGPGAGAAQLLIHRQGFVGKLAGIDVLVDGAIATQLKSPQFAALALAPGRHEVAAEVHGKRTPPLVLDLAPGEVAAAQIVMAFAQGPKLVRDTDVAAVRRTLATMPMVTG